MTKRLVLLILMPLIGLWFLSGCSSSDKESSKTEPPKQELPSLQAKLDAKKAEFEKDLPMELKELFDEGFRQIASSGVVETALKKGDMAPDFELPNATGEQVSLSGLLTNGPVILTWYRGGWCPYCNIQLHSYNEALGEFKKAGGQLVAVSPEIPDSSLSTKEKNNLAFEVLSDVGNKVAHQYGVAYPLPEIIKNFLEGRLDLAAYNGDNTSQLPLAVTYVIDTDRTIQYAFVDADYKKRAEPNDIIAALNQIQKQPATVP